MLRLVVFTAFASSLHGVQPETAPDVAIAGAGIAGLTTALEAARGGAAVAVVDLASVFGGHAIVSEGGLALAGTPLQEKLGARDSPETAYRDFIRWGEDANAPWVRMYVDRSRRDIHDWMTALGVEFDRLMLAEGNSVARFHMNPRRGYGLVEPVYRECLKTGRVRFHWNTRITRLTLETGRVVGMEGVNERTGASFRLRAGAVVLATGGFQSNLGLVRKHWPVGIPMPAKILVGAGVNAHGSGLDLGRQAGALVERLDHQWNYPRGIPDPRYEGTNRGLHVLNFVAPWFNLEGRRFVNENSGATVLLKRMMEQTGGRAWMVFDAVGRKSLIVSGTDWADPKKVDEVILGNSALVHQADSLAGLAKKVGWPVGQFERAAARFNDSVAGGVDPDFGWFHPGDPPAGRPGRAAITPLTTPPFFAIPVFPITRKSMGGLAVDLECRVLDARRRPIPGLFAAGEVTGFNGLNGKAGLEGTFLGPSILQGRILGQRLGKGRKPLPQAPGRDGEPAGPTLVTAECGSCHPIAQLIGTPRKGYWHFERVHRMVLDRAWTCDSCHSEMTTLRASRHKTDPLRQTAGCARCHLGPV